jgi:hypothetical protein
LPLALDFALAVKMHTVVQVDTGADVIRNYRDLLAYFEA